jgi:branched-subunit amino acid aminotransferase/4-amino-4-deoxychorismate lyase
MAGAFLSATTKGVLPVVKIDDQQIGDGSVHKLAKKFHELYQLRVNEYLSKALQNQNT